MPWYIWVVIGVYVVSSLATVLIIDKPRARITPGVALATLVVNGLMLWAIIEGVTQCGSL